MPVRLAIAARPPWPVQSDLVMRAINRADPWRFTDAPPALRRYAGPDVRVPKEAA